MPRTRLRLLLDLHAALKEVERLREDNERLQAPNAELYDENGRLRRALLSLDKQIDAQRAEVERLRGENAELVVVLEAWAEWEHGLLYGDWRDRLDRRYELQVMREAALAKARGADDATG